MHYTCICCGCMLMPALCVRECLSDCDKAFLPLPLRLTKTFLPHIILLLNSLWRACSRKACFFPQGRKEEVLCCFFIPKMCGTGCVSAKAIAGLAPWQGASCQLCFYHAKRCGWGREHSENARGYITWGGV